MKIINGHIYECFYQGIVVYYIDDKHYYSVADAAKALGLTVEEFKEFGNA